MGGCDDCLPPVVGIGIGIGMIESETSRPKDRYRMMVPSLPQRDSQDVVVVVALLLLPLMVHVLVLTEGLDAELLSDSDDKPVVPCEFPYSVPVRGVHTRRTGA
jgi:hypothetical protein